MKTKRLLPLVFAASLAAAFSPASTAATITYFADDLDSLDVLIEEEGRVGIVGPEYSPSGVWSFGWQVEDVDGFPTVAEIATLIRRESHPDPFAFIDPLHGPTFRDISELPYVGSDSLDGDTFDGVFAVSSGVNLDDWVWSIRLTLREEGTPPPTAVPDAGTTALLFGATMLGMLWLRRRIGAGPLTA